MFGQRPLKYTWSLKSQAKWQMSNGVLWLILWIWYVHMWEERLEKRGGTDTNQNILANTEHLVGSEAELRSSRRHPGYSSGSISSSTANSQTSNCTKKENSCFLQPGIKYFEHRLCFILFFYQLESSTGLSRRRKGNLLVEKFCLQHKTILIVKYSVLNSIAMGCYPEGTCLY